MHKALLSADLLSDKVPENLVLLGQETTLSANLSEKGAETSTLSRTLNPHEVCASLEIIFLGFHTNPIYHINY